MPSPIRVYRSRARLPRPTLQSQADTWRRDRLPQLARLPFLFPFLRLVSLPPFSFFALLIWACVYMCFPFNVQLALRSESRGMQGISRHQVRSLCIFCSSLRCASIDALRTRVPYRVPLRKLTPGIPGGLRMWICAIARARLPLQLTDPLAHNCRLTNARTRGTLPSPLQPPVVRCWQVMTEGGAALKQVRGALLVPPCYMTFAHDALPYIPSAHSVRSSSALRGAAARAAPAFEHGQPSTTDTNGGSAAAAQRATAAINWCVSPVPLPPWYSPVYSLCRHRTPPSTRADTPLPRACCLTRHGPDTHYLLALSQAARLRGRDAFVVVAGVRVTCHHIPMIRRCPPQHTARRPISLPSMQGCAQRTMHTTTSRSRSAISQHAVKAARDPCPRRGCPSMYIFLLGISSAI